MDLFIALVLLWGTFKALEEVPFWDNWWLVERYRELATRFLWQGAGIPASWIATVLGLLALLVGVGACVSWCARRAVAIGSPVCG